MFKMLHYKNFYYNGDLNFVLVLFLNHNPLFYIFKSQFPDYYSVPIN